ncbi:tyrosine-type recombinase/integrase [Polyangium sp. 6x1]|uniref:tyrosine-type recombinase/integrase n=1 Tax=Polyangium sp. 6x1 TaxID=3042689 RepID=UPI0024829008|nr:tyrosine-type recombinase/integrase [Polyangium sp. 6x1]MDI1444709.1 tyrosine-type recombinase/integrase [Polyangium sp. 6x1]
MPRLATGNVYERRGKWFARLTIGTKKRQSFMLETCKDEESAIARRAILAELAAKLRKCGRDDIAPDIIKRAAVREGKALDEVRKAVEMIASGQVVQKNKTPTVEEIGKRWTSGELAALYPDRVKKKRSVLTDIYWLAKYVYPLVGGVAIDAFTVDHAETVMRSLPLELSPNSRRAIAQLMHRICGLAILPLRHITANPLPVGFVPRVQLGRAKGWLYPQEDARLLACTRVPLRWRLFYGFLHREGMRRSEALRLTWSDVNIELGAVVLDQNKTDEPRAWALSPGVAAALRAWRDVCAVKGLDVTGSAPVFVDDDGKRKGKALTERESAIRYRKHLEWAGIARPELFARTEARIPIRLHDSRATFITLALANGKTEAWVQDRTGHRSSSMINRYRRAARTAAELGLGECGPLDQAIPEFGGTRERAAERAPRPRRTEPTMQQIQPRSAGLATPGQDDRNPIPLPLPLALPLPPPPQHPR